MTNKYLEKVAGILSAAKTFGRNVSGAGVRKAEKELATLKSRSPGGGVGIEHWMDVGIAVDKRNASRALVGTGVLTGAGGYAAGRAHKNKYVEKAAGLIAEVTGLAAKDAAKKTGAALNKHKGKIATVAASGAAGHYAGKRAAKK